MTTIKRIIKPREGGSAIIKARRGPFLSDHLEEGRPLSIELHPTHAVLRLKGERRRLTLTFQAMWTRASELAVAAARREKRAAREAARKARQSMQKGARRR